MASGEIVDIALPRTDASFGTGRYRDVEVRADPNLPIAEDLKRRDFTINAMAWDIQSGELIDPHQGQSDLQQKIIRCVGQPSARFQEDATRILRAVRLAAELGFTIEQQTADALRQKLALLSDESVTPREVVAEELVRGLAVAPTRMLDLLDEFGIVKTLLPELDAMHGCDQPPQYHSEGDVWMHTRLALIALTSELFMKTFKTGPSPQLFIATLLHDVGKPPTQKTPKRDGTDRIRFDGHTAAGAAIARDISKRLKLASTGKVDPEQLVWLIEHHLDILNLSDMKSSTLERIYLAPAERGTLLQQLCWVDSRASLDPEDVKRGEQFHVSRRFPKLQERLAELRARGFKNNRPAPLLNGRDIMKLLNIKSGPAIGQIIDELRNAQLEGRISTRDKALKFVRSRHAA